FNGSMVESIGIVIAILLATFIAFINEYRAGKEFDILNKVNDNTPVKVCREGAVETIPKSQVVKGDIVIVEQGDEVPADGTLLHPMDQQMSRNLTERASQAPRAT
ncbi:MAG: haloacid dehalogenase, partial [Bacteroidales bacterium]|nr:haloacid dehalogenase [Bacteroidales bacterium]